MVYIKPVLAGAVAFTLITTTAALPAVRMARDENTNDTINSNVNVQKRHGPMVVQAKSIQATKRGYVGGGSSSNGAKKLKQAPLMKAAKLFRSKRDVVEARDEHVHEHIHEHDHDDEHWHEHDHDHMHDHDEHHHHHDDAYDPHHSEHYNYHHGLTDDDEHHHHHHERDLVNIAALNNNSPSNNKSKKITKIHKTKKIGKINKCKGSHFHCNNHKRDEDDANNDQALMEQDSQDTDNTRLVRRRKNSYSNKNGHRNKNTYYGNNRNSGSAGRNKASGGKVVKAQTEISANGVKRTGLLPGRMNPGLEARHHDHHGEEDWEHEHEHDHIHMHEHEHDHDHDHYGVHEHIHSHEHKRSPHREDDHIHMHVYEDDHDDHYHHEHEHEHEHGSYHHHHDKRRHADHDDHDDYDAWLDEMTYPREYRNGHAHIHIHDHEHNDWHGHHHHHHHDKRQTAASSGIPGFVEVANTLAGTTLAKSVAGLVFSKGPDPNASGFLLGTSETQSTQFYLVPTQDMSSLETSQSVNASMTNPDESANTYQLRIPVLDSKTFESNDYCATFDVQPPSPMTMAPCKYKEGFSQIFRYNATTGELTPVYPATDSQPKPMNAAVHYTEPQVMAAKFPVSGDQSPAPVESLAAATDMPSSSSTWSADAAMPTSDASATSSSTESSTDTSSSSSSSSSAPPQSTSSATSDGTAAPADAPKVSLFFIPASTYANGKDVPAMMQTPSTPTTSSADSPLFSAPSQAKIVSPSDNSQDWTDMSGSDSGVVTTTVVVTSTMGADWAQPTSGSSNQGDWTSTDGSSTDSSSAGDSSAWSNTDSSSQ